MTDYVRISSLSKTGDHQARIAVLSVAARELSRLIERNE